MANDNRESADDSELIFRILCEHKDKFAQNLNKVFESYGCSTLESKVPIINDATVERLTGMDKEQRLFAGLAFKSRLARRALEGRLPRTRNRDLKMIKIDNEVVLSAGKVRDKSPLDREELDNQIAQYMKEGALLKKRSEQRHKKFLK